MREVCLDLTVLHFTDPKSKTPDPQPEILKKMPKTPNPKPYTLQVKEKACRRFRSALQRVTVGSPMVDRWSSL